VCVDVSGGNSQAAARSVIDNNTTPMNRADGKPGNPAHPMAISLDGGGVSDFDAVANVKPGSRRGSKQIVPNLSSRRAAALQ
jgi:hypothetical protein